MQCAEAESRRGPSLAVCEMFESISGESTSVGLPAVFVRLAGCNLKCSWCDTRYALGPGEQVNLDGLVGQVGTSHCGLVVVTGGEPLLQAATPDLCTALLALGKRVQVETNGSLDTSVLPEQVQVVLDMKPPSSGETDRMDRTNLARLKPGDNLKMVVADRADFDWALALLEQDSVPADVEVLFSPAADRLAPQVLAEWLLDCDRAVRLQLQLHRVLWPQGAEGRPLPLRQSP